MGSLDRRIQRLEELYGLAEDPQEKARMQHRRAELRAKLDRLAARDGLEPEDEMDPRRQQAIEELAESIKRRREQRDA